jgi:hypothetical protein
VGGFAMSEPERFWIDGHWFYVCWSLNESNPEDWHDDRIGCTGFEERKTQAIVSAKSKLDSGSAA